MLKKSLLSLAVTASLVGLSGCNISSTTDNAGAKPAVQAANEAALEALGVTPVFDPIRSRLPLGIDLIFAAAATSDGTAETGRAGTRDESPVSNAIDRLDGGIGVSTPIDIPMSGSVDDEQSFAGKVFLIQLANAAVDPLITSLDVKDILGQGNAAVPAVQPTYGSDYRVETISVNGGTDNVIRIVPLTPLQAKTKYLAVVTTGVVDADGEAIGVNKNYTDLVGTTAPLVSPALAAVRDALQAWSGLANGYFAAAVDAMALPAVPTISSISAHTTIATDSVLLGMALPTAGANTFTKGAIIKGAKEGVRASDALDQTDFTTVWSTIEATVTDKAATIGAAQAGVQASLAGEELPTPVSRSYKIAPSATYTDSADLGLGEGGLVLQGQLTLPYYLTKATPAEADQAASATLAAAGAIQATPWSADADIGDAIETVLMVGELTAAGAIAGAVDTAEELAALEAAKAAVAIPPVDVDGSSQVNGNFPFAAKTSDVKVPFMLYVPDSAENAGAGDDVPDCNGTGTACPVVVYIHGITGSRGHAIPFASQAAALGYATIAIDLPHHGIAPLTSTGIADPFLGLSFDTGSLRTALTALDPDFDDVSERHFGYGTDASGVVTPLIYDDAATADTDEALAAAAYPNLKANYSGAAFINLNNFMVTRDSMRQAVMDQLNLLATLSDLDFAGDATADLNVSAGNVHIVGHSLGGIIAPVVTSLVNSTWGAVADGVNYPTVTTTDLPLITTQSLVAAGGQLARLIENSPSFAGLAATTSPVDNTGTLDKTFGVLGKLNVGTNGAIVQGEADYEAFLNVLQATIDVVDPITYAGGPALASQKTLVVEMVGDSTADPVVAADITVPNSADTGSTWEAANPSPLAGTDPLIAELGIGTNNVAANGAGAGPKLALKLNKGTHTAILNTTTGTDEADAQAATMEALLGFIHGDGAGVSVTTTSAIAP